MMIKYHLYLSLTISLLLFTCRQDNNADDIVKPEVTETPRINKSKDKADPDRYVISDLRAGPFKVGAELPGPTTMMKYQMRIEQRTRHTEEGPVNESITIISENGEDLLWLKPGLISTNADYDNTIREIVIISPKYKTRENIGVGSTIGNFIKAYPTHGSWYTYVSDMWVVETPSVQAQFIVDGNDFIGPNPEIKSEQAELSILDFRETGKIKSIRIIDFKS